MDIDSYENPDAEALLRLGRGRIARRIAGRERVTTAISAAAVLAAAATLARVAPAHGHLDPGTIMVMLAAYVVAYHVRFVVGHGWTDTTQLVFVPMLFTLPQPLVPLFVIGGGLLARVPNCVRGEERWARAVLGVSDNWGALGPAAVLVVAGQPAFGWGHLPLYALALLTQVGLDMGVTVVRGWVGDRISPRVQAPLLAWVYLVDAALWWIGLFVAAAVAHSPVLMLLAMPGIALLAVFARERRERLDQAVRLSSAYRGTALLLGDVVEADDAYTGSHSRGVLDLSLAVADALGLDATQRRHVEFGALLHDVGKIRVPKEIINKPGPLDDDEWKVMHRHTIEGEQMLQRVGGVLADVGRVVRSSHEHYDGHGYPDGLAGEAIPIESRIVTACDAFSAMTTDRSYRRARPVAVALAELERCAGTQFDPRVVAALRGVLERDGAIGPAAPVIPLPRAA